MPFIRPTRSRLAAGVPAATAAIAVAAHRRAGAGGRRHLRDFTPVGKESLAFSDWRPGLPAESLPSRRPAPFDDEGHARRHGRRQRASPSRQRPARQRTVRAAPVGRLPPGRMAMSIRWLRCGLCSALGALAAVGAHRRAPPSVPVLACTVAPGARPRLSFTCSRSPGRFALRRPDGWLLPCSRARRRGACQFDERPAGARPACPSEHRVRVRAWSPSRCIAVAGSLRLRRLVGSSPASLRDRTRARVCDVRGARRVDRGRDPAPAGRHRAGGRRDARRARRPALDARTRRRARRADRAQSGLPGWTGRRGQAAEREPTGGHDPRPGHRRQRDLPPGNAPLRSPTSRSAPSPETAQPPSTRHSRCRWTSSSWTSPCPAPAASRPRESSRPPRPTSASSP